MKNTYIKIAKAIAMMALVLTASCSEDANLVLDTSQVVGPQLLNPTSSVDLELKIQDETKTATTLVWKASDFGYDTEVTYTIELALAGTNFESPVVAGQTTNQTFYTWTVDQLNTLAIGVGLPAFQKGNLELRIVSSIGSQNSVQSVSDVLTIAITPYTAQLPALSVPGNHQGWDPGTAPLIASSAFGETDYEGYVWLDGEFKFVEPDANGVYAWGNIDYGDDGSFSGILTADGESNAQAATGHYFVQVNTTTLVYAIAKYDWGIIGSATAGGWDADQDMMYNASTGVWELTTDLVAGELKFRANDGWDWNYGDEDADGILDFNAGTNIAIAEAGNYTIVLDLTTPRSYTYTITKN
ncbi:SusE domain-containing protein [Ochrovirga pacifica]|uniref:SusE domain-containing protein n=1 Tax=Ochrovirga pacifica TaxID=1042376 RepID=UPI000255A2EC|nr:SusE domain-containing protein [Ochrovirga pacifica]